MKPIAVVLLAFVLISEAYANTAITKAHHIACLTNEWLDDIFAYLRAGDLDGIDGYTSENKCLILKGGRRVTLGERTLTRTEFSYKGLKLYAPKAALDYECQTI